MTTNVYLVRHAESLYTFDEVNRYLSEKGFLDAKKVTELLSKENITKVISSPYKRAIQTIEGTANHYKLNIEIDDGFKERKIADNSVENFDEVISKYWKDYDFAIQDGETSNFAQNRGVQSLKNVLNKYYGHNIVIGTHGNIMVLIMNYFDGRYHYDFWKSLSMPDIYKLCFDDGRLIDVIRIWS